MFMKKIKRVFVFLLLIVILAAGVRLYKLDQIPPSVSWDEAAVGYNAFTIANWGKDEWGNTFPLVFKSFEDDKHPVHIYATAIVVKLFGLSEFTVRLTSAIFGMLNVIVLFFIARFLVLKSKGSVQDANALAIISAFFLAISPYGIMFSRFNHEANYALFFFMLGLLGFFYGIEGKTRWFIVAALGFCVSILTYHSAIVFIPMLSVFLLVLYRKELWLHKKSLVTPLVITVVFIVIILLNLDLLGFARMRQNALRPEEIRDTIVYERTNNMVLSRLYLSSKYYFSHFQIPYLFISGDPIPRHSSQVIGQFYKVDGLLLIVGLIGLLLKRSRESFIILLWAFLAPIPASSTPGANGWGHAARALFTMGSWHLVSAYGLFTLVRLFRFRVLQVLIIVLVIGAIGYQLYGYMNYYFNEYNKEYAIEWQYGFKEIGQYIKDHPEYHTVFVTDVRSQPYAFIAFHMQTPLPEFLEAISYNTSHTRPSNLVARFDKYIFAYWDPIESMPFPNVLYVVSPSHYDGLRYRQEFVVQKVVKYPNGNDAFFIVSK